MTSFRLLLCAAMVSALASGTSTVGARALDCDLPGLPPSAQPGALVIGCVAPGSSVQVDGRSLRVDAHGRFVFGLGRDASGNVQVTVQNGDAPPRRHRIEVAPREYRIERVDGLPQQTVTPDPQVAARIAREQAAVAQARERDDARADFLDGFARPVTGRISGVYGSQRILNGTPRSPHFGLDVAAATGTEVAAPAPGVVSFAAPDLYLTGGTVLLDHGHGLSSSFLHLSSVDVAPGERVERGQRIGAVGATGRASGPHLHWGFNWFDVRLDPALLPEARQPTAPGD